MELLTVFIYSIKHIFMPGEATPILVALGFVGADRRVLLRLATGLALSNGGIMVAALLIGLFAYQRSSHLILSVTPYLRFMIVAVFFFMALYFLLRGLSIGNQSAGTISGNKLDIITARPFITGLLIGFIPSTSDIGFIPIAPMLLLNRGINGLWITIITVWVGVIVSFTGVSCIISLLPIAYLKKRINRLENILYIVSSIIMLLLAAWLGYYIWLDYYS